MRRVLVGSFELQRWVRKTSEETKHIQQVLESGKAEVENEQALTNMLQLLLMGQQPLVTKDTQAPGDQVHPRRQPFAGLLVPGYGMARWWLGMRWIMQQFKRGTEGKTCLKSRAMR